MNKWQRIKLNAIKAIKKALNVKEPGIDWPVPIPEFHTVHHDYRRFGGNFYVDQQEIDTASFDIVRAKKEHAAKAMGILLLNEGMIEFEESENRIHDRGTIQYNMTIMVVEPKRKERL